jgi:hypothetical protein
MKLIDNKAVKITVPNEVAGLIQKHIPKATVVETRENLSDILVYWGIDEMIKLNQLVTFKKPLPSGHSVLTRPVQVKHLRYYGHATIL